MAQSWLTLPEDSPFPLSNLPWGVVSRAGEPNRRLAVAIGDHALDLAALSSTGLLDGLPLGDATVAEVFGAATLNPLMAAGPFAWQSTRERLTTLLTEPAHESALRPALLQLAEVTNHLPFAVADFVDFYSSEHHARNVAEIFFTGAPELPANWRHLPIGYHGRAGTVVVSGSPIVRPHGQRKPRRAESPEYGPSARLDVEAEVGFVVGAPSESGDAVPASAFADHVFGVVLVNDWSARDLQAWESQPLGPFLGKSFATSISPWVVPLAALAAARTPPPEQQPTVLDYLTDDDPWSLDLALEVRLNGSLIARPPFRTQYWTPGQQLAHLTANGASLRTGDLYASGTVSGPERNQRGSLLELSWGGREPFTLDDGTERTFLEDGDTVAITATAPAVGGGRLGFGAVTGTVYPPASTLSARPASAR